MATNATYTKLQTGEWGIRATISVKSGDRISVAKKSGESKAEIVGKVLFRGNGVCICSIVGARSAATDTSPATVAASSVRTARMGAGHGQAAAVRGYSSYCTDNAACRCFDCV